MYKNENPIIEIRIAKMASNTRMPLLSSNKNKNTSAAVIKIATQIVILYENF